MEPTFEQNPLHNNNHLPYLPKMDQVDIEERLALLTALKENLGGPVTPTAWAFLWLSDIDRLRDLSKFNPHAL